MDIASIVEQTVAPILEQAGYELVLVEFVPRSRILRLFIDREGGVTLDHCTDVSHMVSDLLDAEGLSDRIDGKYFLEVSSPGLDRPLAKPKDFQRFVGRSAQIKTRQPVDGRRQFKGELSRADEQGVQIRVDGRPYEIIYDIIERARLVPELEH